MHRECGNRHVFAEEDIPSSGAQAIRFAMTGANGRRACDGRSSFGTRRAMEWVAHPTPSVNSLERYFADLPVTITVVENSALGCSTILVADTLIPFFRSLTVAGLPSTMNWTDGGTL